MSLQPNPTNDSFLTRAEAAQLLHVSAATMIAWDRQGYGPKATKVSPRITLYSRSSILRFLESRT